MNMPVEMEDRAFRNYMVHRLIKESEYEFTARLTIRNISSEENDKNHQIIINTKLSPNTPELNIMQEFDVQVHNTQVLIFILLLTFIALSPGWCIFSSPTRGRIKLCCHNSSHCGSSNPHHSSSW